MLHKTVGSHLYISRLMSRSSQNSANMQLSVKLQHVIQDICLHKWQLTNLKSIFSLVNFLSAFFWHYGLGLQLTVKSNSRHYIFIIDKAPIMSFWSIYPSHSTKEIWWYGSITKEHIFLHSCIFSELLNKIILL
jgi:hypothetical protein